MTLSEMFSCFKKSAKRLEVLQEYHMDGGEWDTYQKYLKGEPIHIFGELKEWNDMLLAWSNDGKIVERVRVIDSPLSDYLRYQIDLGYLPSALSGQTVNFISRERYNKIVKKYGLKNDIWIFDDEYAFELVYDEKGAFIESHEIDCSLSSQLYNDLALETVPLEHVVKQIRLHKIEIKI